MTQLKGVRTTLDRLTIICLLGFAGVVVIRRASQSTVNTPAATLTMPSSKRAAGGQELSRAYLFGLSESGPRLGPTTASVNAVVFIDYTCGWCRTIDTVFARLRAKYPDHLSVTYHDFVLDTTSLVMDTHTAARCSEKVGKFVAFHEAAFRNQPLAGSRNGWRTLAAKAGVVNFNDFGKCVLSDSVRRLVLADTREARQLGFDGTPGILIGSVQLLGAYSSAVIDSIVASQIRTNDMQFTVKPSSAQQGR